MDTTVGNRLIAEFMGYKKKSFVTGYAGTFFYKGKERFCQLESMKYHTSWDWQIPAWSKISKWFNTLLNGADVSTRDVIHWYRDEYAKGVHNNSIDHCFMMLTKAIEWYNNQNKIQ